MARHRREQRAKERAQASAKKAADRMTAKLQKLLTGRTIVGCQFEGTNEGEYILSLDNGCILCFSSSGDDSTYTSCSLTKEGKELFN